MRWTVEQRDGLVNGISRQDRTSECADIRAELPVLIVLGLLEEADSTEEEVDVFWKNLLLMLTALNFLGGGLAKAV